MKFAVFSTQPYDQKSFEAARKTHAEDLEVTYHKFALSAETVKLATEYEAVCVFVNDSLFDESVLQALYDGGVRAILLRCAGYNNVNLEAAEKLGLFVANVPSYSPEAVAEFAVALVQTLNRNTHRAYTRVREGNFQLEGLQGRTLHGKTVGVIGTGKIGIAFARIMKGFGCSLLAYDVYRNPDFDALGQYVSKFEDLLPKCDVVSLHCPLVDSTRHLINKNTLAHMKDNALLVNTSRGGLIDTAAVIQSLKAQKLRGVALDVYEAEAPLFYSDHSSDIIQDDVFQRLMTFPNVIVSGHQGFFTEEALTEIAETTFKNLDDFKNKRPCRNSVQRK